MFKEDLLGKQSFREKLDLSPLVRWAATRPSKEESAPEQVVAVQEALRRLVEQFTELLRQRAGPPSSAVLSVLKYGQKCNDLKRFSVTNAPPGALNIWTGAPCSPEGEIQALTFYDNQGGAKTIYATGEPICTLLSSPYLLCSASQRLYESAKATTCTGEATYDTLTHISTSRYSQTVSNLVTSVNSMFTWVDKLSS